MPDYLHFECPDNFEIRLSRKTDNIYMSKAGVNCNDNQLKSTTINQKTQTHVLGGQMYNKKSVSKPKCPPDSRNIQTIATKTKSL